MKLLADEEKLTVTGRMEAVDLDLVTLKPLSALLKKEREHPLVERAAKSTLVAFLPPAANVVKTN